MNTLPPKTDPVELLLAMARSRGGKVVVPLTVELLRDVGRAGLSVPLAAGTFGISTRRLYERLNESPELRHAYTSGFAEIRAAAIKGLQDRLLANPDDRAVLNMLTGKYLSETERDELRAARVVGLAKRKDASASDDHA